MRSSQPARRGESRLSAGGRLAGLAPIFGQLGRRLRRLASLLVLAATARLLVLVLALDRGGLGVRCHDRSFVETGVSSAVVCYVAIPGGNRHEALPQVPETVQRRRQLLPRRRRPACAAG